MVPLQAVFVLLPLTATRTVLSRVVLDPRARHRALLRRETGQAGAFAPSRARVQRMDGELFDCKVLEQLTARAYSTNGNLDGCFY